MDNYAPSTLVTEMEFENNLYRKVAFKIIPFLMICYIAAYLDRVNVSFAKLHMLDSLKFSEAIYGLGAGIFFIGYLLFEVPSNLLMHKIGAKKTLARIMIIWGLISAAMAFVQTPIQFYIARFLLGAAEAGFYPAVILYLTYWFPSNRRGKITAIFMIAIPVATILGGPLSGWIMQALQNSHGFQGWQWLFIIEAIPSLILGLLVFKLLNDKIQDAKWLSPQEKQFLNEKIILEKKSQIEHVSLLSLLKDKRVIHMALIYYCIISSISSLSFWLPSVIKSTGVSSILHVGLLTAVPYIFAVILMIYICGHSDKTGERRWHIIIAFLVGGIGLTLSTLFEHNPTLSIVMLSIATAGTMVCSPLFWSLPTAFLDGRSAAAGIAGINSFAALAAFFSPIIIGFITQTTGSTNLGMYFLASFTVIGALLVYLIPKDFIDNGTIAKSPLF